MTAIALAVLWAAICVGWALGYPRGVTAAAASGWAETLAEELATARDDRERVIAVNDALGDLEHALEARARLPRAAAWLAALGSLLALVGGALVAPRLELLGCLGVALVGVLSCLGAGALGRRRARAVRARADARVEKLVGALYHVEVVLPAASQGRRRRRRQGGKNFAAARS